jgi:hypothetical protein
LTETRHARGELCGLLLGDCNGSVLAMAYQNGNKVKPVNYF